MQLQPNARLQGRYRIVRLIAQGGMGAVYEAVDERLGNTVALKQTLMADPQLRAAFEREARLLAGLHHPALPVVSDHFAEDGGQYLVMQFIPGDDLAALLRRRGGPFPVPDALAWADRLLDALDYLHGRTPPIVHRDVKPQNLKLTARGDLVLLDFGLAKGEPTGATNVNPSLFGYTPQYAPLEQIQGSGTDARSDLYSVAATLYELLTGVVGPDALTRAAAAVRGEPDPLRPAHELRPEVPPALSAVLSGALALNPALRPPSAAAMRDALRRAMREERGRGSAVADTQPAWSSAGKTTVALAREGGAGAAQVAAGGALGPAQVPARMRPSLYVGLLGAAVAFLVLILGFEFIRSRTAALPDGMADAATAIAAVDTGSSTITEGGIPDPGGAIGSSRATPLPLGTIVEVPGWKVQVFEQVRGNTAYEQLRRANGNNGPPPEGTEYLLLRSRATSTSEEAQYPFGRGDLRVVGARDVAYDGFAAVPPSPILGDGNGQIAPGDTIEGWSAYLIGVEERDLVAVVGNLITGEARFVELSLGARLVPDPSLEAIGLDGVGQDHREPAEVGETAVTDDWEVTVLEAVRGDAAWELIYAGNRYNEPPAEGMEYIAARVRVRRIGPADEPAFVTDSYFDGSSGGAEVEQQSVVAPEPKLVQMLFPGGSAEGWVAVQVPAGDEDARLTFLNNSVFYEPESPNTRYFRVP